jgi:hypothetical protein
MRMMDYNRIAEVQYRIEHRHEDGSWAPMIEEQNHHDAAEHDPERSWGKGRVFRCTKCDEGVLIEPEEEKPVSPG